MTTEINRRKFLELSLAGSSALALASLLPAGCARYPAPPTDLKVLSAKEYQVLRTIADRMIPRGGAFPAGAEDANVAKLLDSFFAGDVESNKKQLKMALALFEHGPLFFNFKFSRFTGLPPQEQDEYMEGWAKSRLGFRRTIYMVLKKGIFMTFYSQPVSWSAIGYDGPWVK